MNDSTTHSKPPSKDFTNLFQKKKSLPISIITNPSAGQFLFKNNLSNIATSYKDISEKIQNIEKQKMMSQGQTSINPHVFNNFLSVNTISSLLSNQSTVSKNASNIISQRVVPAKNLSTASFSKGFLLNALKANRQQAAISNRHYLQTKTENSLISYAKQKDRKDKKKAANKARGLIKKNISRQKSISVMPSSEKNLRIEYGYLSNEVKSGNNNTTKHSKVTLSNVEEKLVKRNETKKKIAMIKYNFKSFIQMAKQSRKVNERSKEKALTLNAKGTQCIFVNKTRINNNLNQKEKKRGLSHDMEMKDNRPKSTHSKVNFQMKAVQPKNNRTISINQIGLYPLQAALIPHDSSNEVITTKPQPTQPKLQPQEKIPHQPIQVLNVQSYLTNNRLNSSTKAKNSSSNEALGLEGGNNDEEIEQETAVHNDDKYNAFDYLSMQDANSNEEKEDKFDDLNSIVRAIDFKAISIRDTSIFNGTNNAYLKHLSKFNICFDASANKNKCSERKRMNVSISTQDNSNKKCLSPLH